MRGGGNGGWRVKGGGNCEGRMKRWGRTIFGCFFFGSWFFTAISFEVSVNSNFCPDGYLKPPRFLPTSFQLTFQHADLLTSMVPLSCTRARSHKPWDEHTQENLKRTLLFLPKMFAHNFILIFHTQMSPGKMLHKRNFMCTETFKYEREHCLTC